MSKTGKSQTAAKKKRSVAPSVAANVYVLALLAAGIPPKDAVGSLVDVLMRLAAKSES